MPAARSAGCWEWAEGSSSSPPSPIFLSEPQIRAEATSLLAIVPVAIVGTQRQRVYGNVRLRDGLIIGVLSPLGVLAGVALANAIPERALELAFAGLALSSPRR